MVQTTETGRVASSDKGKRSERCGRKATGLQPERARIAGLPKWTEAAVSLFGCTQ